MIYWMFFFFSSVKNCYCCWCCFILSFIAIFSHRRYVRAIVIFIVKVCIVCIVDTYTRYLAHKMLSFKLFFSLLLSLFFYVFFSLTNFTYHNKFVANIHTNHSVKSLAKSSDMICVVYIIISYHIYMYISECLQLMQCAKKEERREKALCIIKYTMYILCSLWMKMCFSQNAKMCQMQTQFGVVVFTLPAMAPPMRTV